jgi:hypothetical protein
MPAVGLRNKPNRTEMNALQQFVAAQGPVMGFLSTETLATLFSIDRLCPVLVRCGACRFTCAAQYVEHLSRCITAGGDYIRDISLPTTTDDYAAQWKPAPPGSAKPYVDSWTRAALAAFPRHLCISRGEDRDFGGAFDGTSVTSDADPGL